MKITEYNAVLKGFRAEVRVLNSDASTSSLVSGVTYF